jgi:hypothetical protein
LKKWANRDRQTSKTPIYTNIACAVVAGASANAAANPTDVLKVRMQAQGVSSTTTNRSLARLFIQIYQQEGVKGLYRVCFI